MNTSILDLHMHSNHSLDGVYDINYILDKCQDKGINIVSVTDHDSCDCYLDIDKNKTKFKGTIIYGMEADSLVGNKTYDILCYDFKPEKVREWAHGQYGTAESRQTKIFEKLVELCESLNIKIDDSDPYKPETEYAHAALFRMLEVVPESKAYLESLNIHTVTDLYRESTTNEKFPLYIDMHIVWPTIEEVRDIIHQNGGKIFLAHPFKYGTSDPMEILESCLPYIDGLEICNEPKTPEQVTFLYEYAKKHNLLISAGNDFHGSEKHPEVGVNGINEMIEQEIISWVDNVTNKIEL